MKRVIVIGILSAVLGANYERGFNFIKSSGGMFDATVIHEGNLTKVDGENYVFNDGASFVIKDVKGMIPLNSKVRLLQSGWGNYYFETVR